MTDTVSNSWIDLLLSDDEPDKVWADVFDRLRDVALEVKRPSALDRETIVPDRLIAESAWNLWNDFTQHAPSVMDELKQFWVKVSSSGTAVLILDGLSLRELPYLVRGAEARKIEPTRVEVRGCEVPTETNRFAAALGLFGRSKLFNNQAPASFVFAGEDVYTDVMDAPFSDCVGQVPSTPRLFLWHKWPDEPLIHLHADKDEGPDVVAREAKEQLMSDGFWRLVDRVRQGRRLVITADHGYAVSKSFSSEVKDEDAIKLLRGTFGAKRCVPEPADNPWPRRNLPPMVVRSQKHLAVMGQRKWTVQAGFPHLCHGGLSLLEAAVPYLELPPL